MNKYLLLALILSGCSTVQKPTLPNASWKCDGNHCYVMLRDGDQIEAQVRFNECLADGKLPSKCIRELD